MQISEIFDQFFHLKITFFFVLCQLKNPWEKMISKFINFEVYFTFLILSRTHWENPHKNIALKQKPIISVTAQNCSTFYVVNECENFSMSLYKIIILNSSVSNFPGSDSGMLQPREKAPHERTGNESKASGAKKGVGCSVDALELFEGRWASKRSEQSLQLGQHQAILASVVADEKQNRLVKKKKKIRYSKYLYRRRQSDIKWTKNSDSQFVLMLDNYLFYFFYSLYTGALMHFLFWGTLAV